MEFVKPPDAFVFDGPNTPQRWARWEKQFNTYFVAAELSTKSKEVQVARLLNAAGADYCRLRKNVIFERHRFWDRHQSEDEPIDKWVKDLRIMAKDCEFETQEDSMIRDKIVYGVHDKRVQERMLRDGELTLTKAIDICRAAESTRSQMLEMSKQNNSSVSVDELKMSSASASSKINNDQRCFTCEGLGHFAHECPSSKNDQKPKCFNCKRVGHFSRDCPNGDNFPRSKRKKRGRGRGRGYDRGARRGMHYDRNTIHEVEDKMEEYIDEFASLSLHSIEVNEVSSSDRPSKRFVKFTFHHPDTKEIIKDEQLKIDSGSARNTMTLNKYRELYPDRVNDQGIPFRRYVEGNVSSLEAYGGGIISHFGTVRLPCQYDKRKFMCRFFLVDVEGPLLLGLPTGEALGIIKINVIDEVTEKSPTGEQVPDLYIHSSTPIEQRPPIRSKEDLKAMYPECFDLNEKYFKDYYYDIKCDPDIEPKADYV